MAWASRAGKDRFIQMLSPAAGEKILDIGAGKGALANSVLQASNQSEVYAVDPDEKRVAAMKRGLPLIRSSVASAERLPFPDGFFDRVYTTMALHHFADLDQAAREVARVLKHGGVFTVVEVDPRSGRAKLFRFFGRLNGEHMNLLSQEELAARLRSSNLFTLATSATLGYAYLVQMTRA